jgi:hypothetical protein
MKGFLMNTITGPEQYLWWYLRWPETILFAWVFGMDKGWKEINEGADLRVPGFYRFIIKWVTPFLLIFVFVGSLIGPAGGDWGASLSSLFSGGGWSLDNGSIIAQIMNKGLKEQIAASTDQVQVAQLEERIVYINGARLLLLAVFATASYLVYIAYKKRIREGDFYEHKCINDDGGYTSNSSQFYHILLLPGTYRQTKTGTRLLY